MQHGDEVIVERKGLNISVTQPNETVSIRVNEPPDFAKRQIALRSAMSEAIDRYPPWRDLSEYHFRLYLIIVLLWLVAEIAIKAIPVTYPRTTTVPTRSNGRMAWVSSLDSLLVSCLNFSASNYPFRIFSAP